MVIMRAKRHSMAKFDAQKNEQFLEQFLYDDNPLERRKSNIKRQVSLTKRRVGAARQTKDVHRANTIEQSGKLSSAI